MSDILALKWENQQLCGIEASLGRGKVRIDRCFLLEWPEASKPAEQPLLAGSWLKEELKRRGVEARQVVVSLPREETVVRPLDLPDAPESELPSLVQFQAATKSTVPLDRLLLDYLPVPKQPGAEGRTVLLATISRQLSERIGTVMKAAELELLSIGVGAASTTELVVREELRRGEDLSGERLVVARCGKQIEISVISQRHLVFTHTTRLSGATAEQQNQAILAEVSRSTVALQRTIPGVRIARVWVLGAADENPQLADALAQRLSCDVRGAFDPLTSADVELKTAEIPGSRGLYSSVVGLLLARSGPTVETIDFLNPRKPVVKRGSKKRQLAIAAGALALIAVTGGVWYWSTVSRLAGEIKSLQDQANGLTLDNQHRKAAGEAAKIIGDWDKRNVPWLDQARQIGESLGGRDHIYLEKLHLAAGSRGSLGTVTLDGFAKGRPDSDSLDAQLVKRGFTVKPHAANVDSKDSEYPYRIEVDVDLVEGTPAHAVP